MVRRPVAQSSLNKSMGCGDLGKFDVKYFEGSRETLDTNQFKHVDELSNALTYPKWFSWNTFNSVGAITIPVVQGNVATTNALWRKAWTLTPVVWSMSILPWAVSWSSSVWLVPDEVRSVPDEVLSLLLNIGALLTVKLRGSLMMNKKCMYEQVAWYICDLWMMVDRKEVQLNLTFVDKFNHLRVGYTCQTWNKYCPSDIWKIGHSKGSRMQMCSFSKGPPLVLERKEIQNIVCTLCQILSSQTLHVWTVFGQRIQTKYWGKFWAFRRSVFVQCLANTFMTNIMPNGPLDKTFARD